MKKHAPLLTLLVLLIALGVFLVPGIGQNQTILVSPPVPAAVPALNKRGNSQVFQLAVDNTVAAAGTPFCDDGSGNTTTVGCSGGGGGAFSALTGGTNTAAAMVVGTGASLGTSGTGTIFGNGIRTYTVGTLPGSPSAGAQAYVTDGLSNTDCTGGGGTTKVLCGYTGSAWLNESGGSATGVLTSGVGDPGLPNPLPVQARSCVSCTSLAFSSNVTSGNLLTIGAGFATASCGTSFTTISDTLGSTWARADGVSGGGGLTVVQYFALANGSGADTVSWTCTGTSFPTTAIAEYSGTQASVDVSAAVVGASAPSLTTTLMNDLFVSFLGFNHSGTVCTATAGGTIQSQSNGADGACIGYQLPGAAGVYAGAIHSPDNDTGYVNVAFKGTTVASPGNNGDWYLNTTTGVLWGPKAGGVWSKSTAAWHSGPGSNGQFILTGSPSMGTCGTSPSLATGASNNSGTINVGSGVVTACTLNFSPSFTNTPTCQVADNSTAITAAVTSVSVSAVTFSTSATVGSGKIYYSCF